MNEHLATLAETAKLAHDHLMAELVGAIKDKTATVEEAKAVLVYAGIGTTGHEGMSLEIAGQK